MATTPWYTSDKLIEAVKRKIALPISQVTFTEDDILAFANEEMFISQVPAVMQYHEEYFVYRVQVPLVSNISRYSIPDRAVGMKLRDLFWSDASGNYFEMTRINEDDKAYFQSNIGANQAVHKFYLENNDVILTPSVVGDPTGRLNYFIFLRPNQLVRDTRARIFTAFTQDVELSTNPIAGDKFIIQTGTNAVTPSVYEFIAVESATYTIAPPSPAVDSTILKFTSDHNIPTNTNFSVLIGTTSYSATSIYPNQIRIGVSGTYSGSVTIEDSFVIGGTTLVTLTNLSNTININDLTSSVDTTHQIMHLRYKDISTYISSKSNSFSIESLVGFVLNSSSVGLISKGSVVDFLQTKPGHRTFAYDVEVQEVTSINSEPVIKVERSDLLTYYSNGYNFQPAIANIQVGDYVCLANECIIPQIPPDLHNVLAERTAARILAAQGDSEGLQISNAKLQEIEVRQGSLLDNRVEGAPQKVLARHSLLHYGRIGPRRRF